MTDTAPENAADHHDDEEPAAPASAIALINACNRFATTLQMPAGDYHPGQHG